MGKFFEEFSGQEVKRGLVFSLWGCKGHLFKGCEFMMGRQKCGSKEGEQHFSSLKILVGFGFSDLMWG